MDISVIIVNYNVKYFLEQSLISLRKAAKGFSVEYIVVDNASSDGSADYIRQNFPEVKLIANAENLGFGRANNIGLKRAQGRFLLIINPDTVVGEDTLRVLINYMETNPTIGAIGPKILDREGKFDPASRRGFPTPFAAFSKLSGLSSLFPKSKTFNQYNLTYIDPEHECEIDSLQGSFMLVRRETYEQTGGFDEEYFMYGEDIDWCYRIKQAGWRVFYQPAAKIIHYGGESALRSNIDTRAEFFQAMHLFVKKHFAQQMPLAIPLIRMGIYIRYILDWCSRRLPLLRAPVIDLAILNTGLFIGRLIRYGNFGIPPRLPLGYTIYNLSWLAIMLFFGVYGRKKSSMANTVTAMVVGLAFLFSFTYFFKQFAFSRFVLLFTAWLALTAIPGWRWLVIKLLEVKNIKEFFKRRALLIGVDDLTLKIAQKAREKSDYPIKVVGFLDKQHDRLGQKIAGLEVVGAFEEAENIIARLSIEEVIFSAASIPYGEIVKFIDRFQGKVAFKLIPETALESSDGEIPFLELGFSRKPKWFSRWKR